MAAKNIAAAITFLLIVSVSVFTVPYLYAQTANQPVFPQSFLDLISGAGATNTASSTVTLSATPNPLQTESLAIIEAKLANSLLDSQTEFTWFFDGVKRSDLSGRGNSVAAFAVPANGKNTLKVKVEVKFPANATTSAETVFLVQTSPYTQMLDNLQTQADQLISQGQETASQLSLSLEMDPESPKPKSRVTFNLHSFQTDLGTADIAWFFNGKRIANGKGVTRVQTTFGDVGSVNVIRVTAETPSGLRGEKELAISPSTIKFYWWTNTYVPGWYRGKALPAPGSVVMAQAIPSVPAGIAATLEYSWYLNDDIVAGASGIGKAVFPYTIPLADFFPISLKVKVANQAKTLTAEASFAPPLADYTPLMYEVKPLAGADHSAAVKTLTRQAGNTIDVTVEPFYMPRSTVAALNYIWNLNGADIANTDKRPWIFTLTSAKDAVGSQQIKVSLVDGKNEKIKASQSLTIDLK